MSIHKQCGHPGMKWMLYFSKVVDPAVKKADIRMVMQRCKAMSVNRPSASAMAKRKLECYPCLEQAGDRCYACWQPALFDYYGLWSLLLCHLATAASTRHYQHNTPIGVHLLWLGPTCWNINRQWCSIFFRAIQSVWLRFQCAYMPAGNSIVERSQWSIKVIAARKWYSIPEHFTHL